MESASRFALIHHQLPVETTHRAVQMVLLASALAAALG